MIKDGKEVAKPKGTPAEASIFGELALLSNSARAATIKVVSETAKTLCMDKKSFDLLLGPLEAIQERGLTGDTRCFLGLCGICVPWAFRHVCRRPCCRVL